MTGAQEIVLRPQLCLRQETQHQKRTATPLPITAAVWDISSGVSLRRGQYGNVSLNVSAFKLQNPNLSVVSKWTLFEDGRTSKATLNQLSF